MDDVVEGIRRMTDGLRVYNDPTITSYFRVVIIVSILLQSNKYTMPDILHPNNTYYNIHTEPPTSNRKVTLTTNPTAGKHCKGNLPARKRGVLKPARCHQRSAGFNRHALGFFVEHLWLKYCICKGSIVL